MSFSTVPAYLTREGIFTVSVLILLSPSLLVTTILLAKLGAAATCYRYTGSSGFCLSLFCFSTSTDYYSVNMGPISRKLKAGREGEAVITVIYYCKCDFLYLVKPRSLYCLYRLMLHQEH